MQFAGVRKKEGGLLLPIFQLFILHVFIEEVIDRLDGKAGGDLPEGVDLHLEALQLLMYTRLLLFIFLFGHASLQVSAYLTQNEFFWLPLADLKSQKLP